MPKKNAFWFFMRELMDEMRNDGVEVSSFAEMPAYAGPKWSGMTADQRRPYEEMVQSDCMKTVEVRPTGKMNNMRQLIAEHAEKEQAKKDVKTKRQQDINGLRLTWPPGNDLIKERFLLISFEYFVKTREEEYLPCEVGLIEFSLEKGILRKYNSFIDPGPCPKGYMFEERLRSEQRHQIPCCDRYSISQFSDAERAAFKDLDKIVEGIVAFVSEGAAPGYNSVFTFGDDVEMVIGCLNFLYSKSKGFASFGPKSLPRILPLEHLLRQFYYHSDKVTGIPPSVNSFQRVLTQSVWDYESGICCDFHDEVETRFCALSQVHRWSFAIFDAMKLPVRDEEDLAKSVKRKPDHTLKSVYEFTLTSKHLPSPTKSSYAVLKRNDIPGGPRNRDDFSIRSVSGTSLASSRTDVRSKQEFSAATSGHPASSSSSSRSHQRPPLSASPPPLPPGTPMRFGRGFGLESRVSGVGAWANRSSVESPVHSSSTSLNEANGKIGAKQRQERQHIPFGRGRGCVVKSK